MPTGFRNMRRPMGLSGCSCRGLGSLLPRSPLLPARLPRWKPLPPTGLVGSKAAGERTAMNKGRIRGFSRCQAPSFIPLLGSPWLTLPCSCPSPTRATAALSLCVVAAEPEGAEMGFGNSAGRAGRPLGHGGGLRCAQSPPGTVRL